ncbi:MAG: hypothetical protein Satyrvirus11_22 [Satyrvirus sp.]|uniref:Uncharacterized protein n=1 Tax=Satyrvirus sp. TaxID=2487771 RepID=A0A3G5ADT7_9VIRU|nr:MAG: hypothetical protein Satyrvirus11_22 [Satyrvirus sp.]
MQKTEPKSLLTSELKQILTTEEYDKLIDKTYEYRYNNDPFYKLTLEQIVDSLNRRKMFPWDLGNKKIPGNQKIYYVPAYSDEKGPDDKFFLENNVPDCIAFFPKWKSIFTTHDPNFIIAPDKYSILFEDNIIDMLKKLL